MKLKYRGVSYDYDPARDLIDDRFDQRREPFTLTYRGTPYELSPRHQVPNTYQPRTAYQLTYRGNKYWVQRPIEAPSARPIEPKATRQRMNELEQVHREHLLRNLDHRIEVAREKDDLSLLAMLEQERRQLV
jgi:hypothetical protein